VKISVTLLALGAVVSVAAAAARDDEPRAQMTRYLERVIATRPLKVGAFEGVHTNEIGVERTVTNGKADSTYFSLCNDWGEFSLWVADYSIVSMTAHADSVIAKVALTTVAAQAPDPKREEDGYYIATQRVQEDTASFLVIRSPENAGRWMVCGDARMQIRGRWEDVSVSRMGRTVSWRPRGASRVSALAKVDSIRTARGKPLARTPVIDP
jgi:hypothetical protein